MANKQGDTNPTVKTIIENYLAKSRYDGLYDTGCGCEANDLIPCHETNIENCRAGYKAQVEDGNTHGYYDGADWIIQAERPGEPYPPFPEMHDCPNCGPHPMQKEVVISQGVPIDNVAGLPSICVKCLGCNACGPKFKFFKSDDTVAKVAIQRKAVEAWNGMFGQQKGK